MASSRADLNSEAICKARHQVVFTKRGSNVASGSRTDLCAMRLGAIARVMPRTDLRRDPTAHLILTLPSERSTLSRAVARSGNPVLLSMPVTCKRSNTTPSRTLRQHVSSRRAREADPLRRLLIQATKVH